MIRRATFRDIDRLNDLLFQVQKIHADKRPDIFKQGAKKYTVRELETIIADDRTPVFVYESDQGVQGYAFCIYRTTEENDQLHRRRTLYIDDLCVDQEARGRQIGTALYQHVRETAARTGCDSVTLNVWEVNPSAMAFYRKMGLSPLKTTMEYII